MKAIILQFVFSCLFFSCLNVNRDKQVDKTDLTGDDYRLFQNTPAWELAKAVQDENEKKINEIVANESSLINYQEIKYGNTLLMLTIMNQQIKPFKVLLVHKADVSIHNTYDGTSALIEACSYKQYDIKFAELLLQNGANVNDVEAGVRRQGNTTRFTPLMAAAKTGKIDLVKLLVKRGADINYQNEYKQSALSNAVMQSKYQVTLYLLESGADYKKPIFYRPDYSVPSELHNSNDKGRPMYLVDILREDFFEFDTEEYNYKMRIVDFLKSKGIDYRAAPIPEYIQKKAQENYPNNWQEYLEKY